MAPSSVPASESKYLYRRAGVAAAVVTVPFLPALAEAFRLTQTNGLQNYAPAVPLIAAYLGWKGRDPSEAEGEAREHAALRGNSGTEDPQGNRRPHGRTWFSWVDVRPPLGIAAPLTAAAALVGARVASDPALAAGLRVIAWITLVAGVLVLTLGRVGFARWRLPILLLLFIAPLPQAVVTACEQALQHGSADCARLLLEAHGTPVHLDRLTLHLRGMTLWVAPECSGLRSSLVLLLVTVIAAGTLLRTPAARVALVLAVAPIAIARNGLRIFVIGTMCVQQGPAALDSLLHRHGGPVFFALSLAPWTLLLFALCRREAVARSPVKISR